MKKMIRTVLMASLACTLAFGMSHAGEAQAAAKGKVKSVSITSPVSVKSGKTGKYTLYQVKGQKASKTIKAKIKVSGKISKKVYFKSSNKKVLTVGKTSGKMTTTGSKTGTATVTAYAAGNSKVNAKLKVTVKNFDPKMTATGLDNLTYAGKTLNGSVKVSGTGLKSVTYKSTNASVLTVDKYGKVLVKGAGTAKITAKAYSKSGVAKTLTKTVTVKKAAEPQKPQPENPKPEEPQSIAPIEYSNVYFNYAGQIRKQRANVALVPQEADVPFTVADEKGATGVVLVKASAEADTEYYMNALVAGDKLVIAPKDDATITSVVSDNTENIATKAEDGTWTIVPGALKIENGVVKGEKITVTIADDSYVINTVSDCIPGLTVGANTVSAENAGVYTMAIDKFMLRINTSGEVVYYRNMLCVGELMAENFQRQETKDGVFYTMFVELNEDFRHAQGGYSSGMYVVMDENYNEIDEVLMLPNSDVNHKHGTGYLDQHEFVVIGKDHYLTLSYTPLRVSNLPEEIKGVDGTSVAYVWAGIFQEVKNGKVVKEINTTDYPLLYESAVEKINYAGSSDEGAIFDLNVNGQVVPTWFLSEGWQDYVHPNSLDYTLKADGSVDKLLVSMRDQSAVYQFDMKSGEIEWILGGKASTLTGYDAYTKTRKDDNGVEFKALTFGQHFARYTNKNADGTVSGNPVISVFDNQTGSAPFLTMPTPYPTLTRVFKAEINEAAKTAKVSDVIDGTYLNTKTDKYHIASHCGSVEYKNVNAVVIGWGLHAVVDNIGPFVPDTAAPTDPSYGPLHRGDRPIVSEYDMANDEVTFELSAQRNNNVKSSEALFSYRTYKTAE